MTPPETRYGDWEHCYLCWKDGRTEPDYPEFRLEQGSQCRFICLEHLADPRRPRWPVGIISRTSMSDGARITWLQDEAAMRMASYEERLRNAFQPALFEDLEEAS